MNAQWFQRATFLLFVVLILYLNFQIFEPFFTPIAWAAVLAVTRNWNLSCGVGFGLLVLMLWITGQATKRVIYTMTLLPIIGAKKLLQAWQGRRVAA